MKKIMERRRSNPEEFRDRKRIPSAPVRLPITRLEALGLKGSAY